MTRISSLLLATGLAILPAGAFAQQNATPSTTQMAQPATTAAQTTKSDVKTPAMHMTKTPAATVKTTVVSKDTKATHAKLGTTTPATPAKTAEPSKS